MRASTAGLSRPTANGPSQAAAGPDRLTLTAFAVSVLLGGGNAVAVRYSNAELPPFWGAALRFASASSLFWLYVIARRLTLPRGRALLGAVIYGLLSFGLSYCFIYWALVKVPAGPAQITLALVPLITLFFAAAHHLERFRLRGLVGALISVAGIGLAFSEQMSTDVPLGPLLAVIAGGCCIAEGAVLVKHFPRSHPAVTNAVSMGTGTLLLAAVSLIAGERWFLPEKPATWAAFTFLVLIGSVVVFALFLFVIARWTASATSYQFVLVPLVTVALASFLANEPVTPVLLLGGFLVLVGVWVGALSGRSSGQPAKARVSEAAAAHK